MGKPLRESRIKEGTRMKSLTVGIGLGILLLTSVLSNAQDHGPIKLQCEGKYTNFSKAEYRDLPVKGIFVEILGDRVKVVGAPGFDATYSVIKRFENGVGIQLDSNSSFGGFLNRLSGELSLAEKDEVQKDGSFKKYRQIINATCRSARPLF